MTFPRFSLAALLSLFLAMFACQGLAQDTRTVTEPSFPTGCEVLTASLYITGGEPSSETAFDTASIQSVLNANACVELETSGVDDAFLIQPVTIPKGATLLVDAGVTIFASRNPADYQISGTGEDTCGTYSGSGGGCEPLITIATNTSTTTPGSSIMGYGIINGRGGDYLIVNGVVQSYSWWDNAAAGGGNQSNPVMIQATKADNFTLYKITLQNSPKMHVIYKDGSGFTVWDAKVITPYNADNTDGIDPTGSNNITITNSYISDGDDDVAIGSSSTEYAASNITVSNDHVYGGHGVSIGSITNGGVSNMLVDHVNFAGTVGDDFATGIRIKSAEDRGGIIQDITYQNICEQNLRYPLQLNPFYDTGTGTEYPYFKSIALHNVNVLNVPSNAKIELQGFNATYPAGLTLDNVVFPSTLPTSAISPAPEYISITLGPGPLTPAFLQSLTGTGVSYDGSITNPSEATYACDDAFGYLTGELFLSDATLTNQQSLTETAPATFTLNAVLEPTVANSIPPSTSIDFLEGSTVVGTAAVSGNGTLASVTLSGVAAGMHTYTAQYPGDSNYAAIDFGSVTVTVAGEADYSIVAAPGTVVTPAGGTATTLISLIPTNDFSGIVSLSCASLPSLMSCVFNPAVLTLQGTNATLSSELTIETGAATAMRQSSSPAVFFAGCFFAPVVVTWLVFFRRLNRTTLRSLASIGVISIVAISASGCGSGTQHTLDVQIGTATVTVIASSGNLTHQTNLTVEVD